MGKPYLKIFILLASVLAAVFSIRGNGTPAGQTLQKARHYFLAGNIADAEGRSEEAYEYYRKAWQLAPDYDEAAYYYGIARLHNDCDTMRTATEVNRSTALAKQFADSHPEDVQENLYYAYLASFTDPADAVRVYEEVFSMFPERTPVLIQIADIEARQRHYDKAIEALGRYEKIEGVSPDVSLRKLQLMIHKADTVGALAEAARLVETHPSDLRFRMLRCSLAGGVGDTLLLERELRAAEKIDPDNGAVKIGLADLAMSRGDSVAYDNYIYAALLSPDLELEQKRNMAGAYLQQLLTDKGDRERGEELFRTLEKQYPHQPEVLELEARYRMATGRKPEAIELMEYAVSLEPDNETYWRQLLAYAFSARDHRKMKQVYEEAKTHFNPDTDMKMLYALGCSDAGNFEEGLEIYGEVLSPIIGISDPSADLGNLKPFPKIDLYQSDVLKGVYSAASDLYWKAGRKDECFSACRNVLFLEPDDALALNNYAYFLAESDRDLPLALEMAQKAVESEPSSPTYLDTLAWVFYKEGEIEEALEWQRKAIEIIETYPEAAPHGELYEHLGEMLKASGDKEGARKAAEKAKELNEGGK